ncbi:MAG: tetraacyldisaccharide 4'-kinase [Saprospiraceae bacterium]|jgi:tetraacyldisaccharide 4'-kinase
MIQNFLVRLLLAPFSLLYGVGVSLRNFFYSNNLLKGVEFDIPIISVGNLSLGGAGKTPHIEYLIRLLKDYINVATLSRGYKRKTKGFLIVLPSHNAEMTGDEPLQFRRKFDNILVTIAESRTFAIPKIIMDRPDTQAILLDDAFQHRSVKPGLNILLTEYALPFTRDYLLPSGRLREARSAYHRADILIISKCPPQITEEEKINMIDEIKPFPMQRIYFSYYEYEQPYFFLQRNYVFPLKENVDVLLICAIANTDYLLEYLYEKVNYVKALEYADHHFFNSFDISNLKNEFDKIESDRKIILTTEKDAMRLELHKDFILQNKLPVYVLPVKVAFHFNEGKLFDKDVKDFLLNFRA